MAAPVLTSILQPITSSFGWSLTNDDSMRQSSSPFATRLVLPPNGIQTSMPNPQSDWGRGVSLINSVGQTRPSSAQTQKSEHPCQLGEPCACGGRCKAAPNTITGTNIQEDRNKLSKGEILQKLNTIQNHPNGPIITNDLSNKLKNSSLSSADAMKFAEDAKFQRRVFKTAPGASTSSHILFPDGEKAIITARVLDNRDIVLAIVDPSSANERLKIILPIRSDGSGWDLKINNTVVPNTFLNKSLMLDLLPIYASGLVIAEKLIRSKIGQIDQAPAPSSPPSSTPPCIQHDLKCSSLIGEDWPWTGDHEHVEITFFVAGGLTIRPFVGDCCKQHDVDIWCAHHLTAIDGADEAVIKCILGKIGSAATDALSDRINHENFIAAAIDILLSMPLLLAQIAAFDAVMEIIMSVAYFVTFHAANAFKVHSLLDPSLTNFDHSHDKSCLCGGSEPTQWCPDPCRDICKEMGPAAAAAELSNCFNCSWKCTFQNGKPTGKIFDRGTDPSKPCCPGTDEFATVTEPDGTSFTSGCSKFFTDQNAPCPTCEPCQWNCKSADKGLTWSWFHDLTPNGLPCCNDIPSDQVCCDWNCWQDPDFTGYDLRPGKLVTDEWGNTYWKFEPPEGFTCGPINEQNVGDLYPCTYP